MTIQPLPARVVLLHRILRIAVIAVPAAVIVALFASSDRATRVHWLESATTSALVAESARDPYDEELNEVTAHRLIQDGQDEKAYDLMLQLTKRIPNSAECWDQYAKAAAQTNRDLVALEGYRKEIQIDPGSAATHAIIGSMYIKAGLNSEGLAEVETARHLNKNMQIDALLWANALEAKGREQEAWQCLADAIRINPQMDSSYAELGKIALRLHREDEAETMMMRRINMTPTYDVANVRGALARLLVAVSQDPKTVEEALYVAKLAAHEQNAAAQVPLAEILLIQKDLKGAQSVLENGLKMDRALGIKTRNQDCLRMLAAIANADGRVADARSYRTELPPEATPQLIALRDAAARDARNVPKQMAYAGALEQFGDYCHAAEVCDEVLAFNHDDPQANKMVARCRDEAMRKLDADEKTAAKAHSVSVDERVMHAQP